LEDIEKQIPYKYQRKLVADICQSKLIDEFPDAKFVIFLFYCCNLLVQRIKDIVNMHRWVVRGAINQIPIPLEEQQFRPNEEEVNVSFEYLKQWIQEHQNPTLESIHIYFEIGEYLFFREDLNGAIPFFQFSKKYLQSINRYI
jgi:hypothetical protein